MGRQKQWELVNEERNTAGSEFIEELISRTERMDVGSGWIYRTRIYEGNTVSVAMVYVFPTADAAGS